MSTQTNKAVIRRFYKEVVNQQNLNLADELIVENYLHHDPNLPPEVQQGRENYKQGFSIFLKAFPDLKGTIEDLVAEEDKVVARITWQGTHKGELMGIPPSGNKVNFNLSGISRLENGKLAEGWVVFDLMTMMRQVGAIS